MLAVAHTRSITKLRIFRKQTLFSRGPASTGAKNRQPERRTMRAMLINGESLQWGSVPDPQPRADEVVIEVHAAAVNRADLMQRAGTYPSPPGWPAWMGLEVSGVIRHAPAFARWKPGDRVCALLGGGGYAEYVAVPMDMVLPVPAGLSLVEAAAIPESFATAFLNLHLEAEMTRGDTVFIQAGASGLGVAAIQLAKAAGATVVTTVGSEQKRAFVAGFGADVIINYKTTDLTAALRQHPVNIALDCVAGPDLGHHLACMQHGGRWIVIATLSSPIATIDVGDLFRRGIRLIGSTLRSRSVAAKAGILSRLEEQVWPAFARGTMRLAIHSTLPIAKADEAHGILNRNANMGKVVLTMPAADPSASRTEHA
jgi:NADPH:quinone reductase